MKSKAQIRYERQEIRKKLMPILHDISSEYGEGFLIQIVEDFLGRNGDIYRIRPEMTRKELMEKLAENDAIDIAGWERNDDIIW